MATPMTVSQVVAQCKKWGIPYEVYSAAVGRPGSFTPIGFIVHHTGGPFTESDSYLRFLFEVGRPAEGIPAQLCNFSGGPSGKIYIGKMARANHAGRGSWRTRLLVGSENYDGYNKEISPGPDDYGTANGLYYGLEINYPGTVPMKDAQWRSSTRLAAAIMDFHGWTALSTIDHAEHSSRKRDIGSHVMTEFRRDVRDLLKNGPGGSTGTKDWFDMATKAELAEVVDARIKAAIPTIVNAVLSTDGIVKAPPSATTVETNPYWMLKSHVTSTTEYTRYLIPKMITELRSELLAAIQGSSSDAKLDAIAAVIAEVKGLTATEAASIKEQLSNLFAENTRWNDINEMWEDFERTWKELSIPKLDRIIQLMEERL